MDNLYANQIKIMDYWSLVNMLMMQITPDVRKCVLDRLSEMNNQLLMNTNMLSNMSMNPRKKDPVEVQHPIDNVNFRNSMNPIPLNMVIGNNQPNLYSNANENQYNPQDAIRGSRGSDEYNMKNHSPTKEIDLDDIILDQKLEKIKNLYTKLITEKRQERKERKQRK